MFNFLIKNNIGEPPWEYDLVYNLPESEYPKYLAKIFKYRTGEKLPLKYDFKNRNWIIDKKRCKTFNQKMQWIKLYGITDLMRKCTDKITVRDYVKEKIGSEYLKTVLQICNSFDEIDFDKLPDSFVMKCNHGCKWQYIIKDKNDYLNTPTFVDITKQQITGWLNQEFWVWVGFELQYKGINPKILIEPLMRDNINLPCQQIQLYFFNNLLKFIVKIYNDKEITVWDEKLNFAENVFNTKEKNLNIKADKLIKLTNDLSIKLISKSNFKFVRVDWMIYQNKAYFEELTFTPYSGFIKFDKKWNLKLGSFIEL